MEFSIFVVNPGSTSTKIGIFRNGTGIFEKVIRHDPEELSAFPTAASQLDYRLAAVLKAAGEWGALSAIDAFIGRGGLLRPLAGGTYSVTQNMLDDLKNSRYGDHASNLGAIIVSELALKYGKPCFVADPPVVDELMDEARVTGLAGMEHVSVFHALNHKAAALRAAADAGVEYRKGCFIVAHLGGGISVGAHRYGRVVDVNNGIEEGPFSPERAGSLPSLQLMELCYSGRYTRAEMKKLLVGKGGLYSHTGTTDCKRLEALALQDAEMDKLFEAFTFRISREICACSAALEGTIDRIVITGGLAHSSYIVEKIMKRVSFLAPVAVYPGEDELAALAQSALRVLQGTEGALSY